MAVTASSVEIVSGAYALVVYISRRMRTRDAEEIMPHLWSPTPEDLAAHSVHGGASWVALKDGQPVAAWGVQERLPQVWTVWMYATDDWPAVALSATRHIKSVVREHMISRGAVRADCWSMDGHDEAHRWLEVLGARREASLEDYGRNRQTYHCYSWTKTRLENGEF